MKPLLLAAALALPAGLAQAFTVTYQNSDNVFGSNGSAAVKIESIDPETTLNVRAGGFALTGDLFGTGPQDFTAWCLDIATTMRNGKNYEITHTPFDARMLTGGQIGRIRSLFDTFYTGPIWSNALQSAGFQLALWEIVYETVPVLSLYAGNFSATNSAAAIAQGQSYLDGLNPSAKQTWSLVFLQSHQHKSQNLVTATPVPVPVPGAAGMMLLALAGLGAVARRRAA